ncbi:hypothetical protein BKA62DRAFT_32027 [Auriculariales sp. MPI-PUGE-AT-0066]|nr:hypothetical protein BKA62DRAFT_32027 [Auriculariales sp. MPI-PUGE-AT-0066]
MLGSPSTDSESLLDSLSSFTDDAVHVHHSDKVKDSIPFALSLLDTSTKPYESTWSWYPALELTVAPVLIDHRQPYIAPIQPQAPLVVTADGLQIIAPTPRHAYNKFEAVMDFNPDDLLDATAQPDRSLASRVPTALPLPQYLHQTAPIPPSQLGPQTAPAHWRHPSAGTVVQPQSGTSFAQKRSHSVFSRDDTVSQFSEGLSPNAALSRKRARRSPASTSTVPQHSYYQTASRVNHSALWQHAQPTSFSTAGQPFAYMRYGPQASTTTAPSRHNRLASANHQLQLQRYDTLPRTTSFGMSSLPVTYYSSFFPTASAHLFPTTAPHAFAAGQ